MKPTKQEAIDAAKKALNDAYDAADKAAEATADAAYEAYRAELARIEQEYPDE